MVLGGLNDMARRRTLRRWQDLAANVDAMDPAALASLREQTGKDRAILDQTLAQIDRRLNGASESTAPVAPPDSDWIWRPEVFSNSLTVPGYAGIASDTDLGDSTKMFHDCPLSEITLRQTSGRAYSASAPFGVAFDVLNFAGTFLSVVIDLPEDGTTNLTLSHVVQVSMQIEAERDIDVFIRLNVKHGPNTEQVVRQVDMAQSAPFVDFDLAYTEITESRIERAWLDIIFGDPRMNRIALRDLVVSRHLRAEM